MLVSFDLSQKSLQLKTDSTFGSGDSISIKFKAGTSTYDIGFAISMTDPPSYRVMSCGAWTTFTKPNTDVPRRWTVTYTGTSLVLFCEGVQVWYSELTYILHYQKQN